MAKNFNNASEAFLGKPEPVPASETTEEKPEQAGGITIPEGYRLVQEPKTARVQLLLTPRMKEEVKRAADARGISVNELFNEVMTAYLEGRK